jgi:LacI family transcriptional regulator
MVFIDREPVGIEADAVVTDNAVGSAMAASHLIAQGHTKLAYLGDRTDIQTARERRRGFIEEVGRAGIATSSVPVLEGLHDEDSARRARPSVADIGGTRPRPSSPARTWSRSALCGR